MTEAGYHPLPVVGPGSAWGCCITGGLPALVTRQGSREERAAVAVPGQVDVWIGLDVILATLRTGPPYQSARPAPSRAEAA